MMLRRRYYGKEMMDDFSITDRRLDTALKELNIINTYLGGNSVTRSGLKTLLKLTGASQNNLTILDIGSGGSDIFYKLKKAYSRIKWMSIDLNIQACRYDKKNNHATDVACCNALKLPFKDKSFDIVHCSLFLHHFSEDDIVELLRSFSRIARSGIIINDLRRNILAFTGIKLVTALFSKSEMVRNDGPISVKRGFLIDELQSLLVRSKLNRYFISRKWAFRWLVCILLFEDYD